MVGEGGRLRRPNHIGGRPAGAAGNRPTPAVASTGGAAGGGRGGGGFRLASSLATRSLTMALVASCSLAASTSLAASCSSCSRAISTATCARTMLPTPSMLTMLSRWLFRPLLVRPAPASRAVCRCGDGAGLPALRDAWPVPTPGDDVARGWATAPRVGNGVDADALELERGVAARDELDRGRCWLWLWLWLRTRAVAAAEDGRCCCCCAAACEPTAEPPRERSAERRVSRSGLTKMPCPGSHAKYLVAPRPARGSMTNWSSGFAMLAAPAPEGRAFSPRRVDGAWPE